MRAIPARLSECNWLAPRSLPRSLGFEFWCHCVKAALPSCCGPASASGPSFSWKDIGIHGGSESSLPVGWTWMGMMTCLPTWNIAVS